MITDHDEFRSELRRLINRTSVDARANIPDYELTEMICQFIEENARPSSEIRELLSRELLSFPGDAA